MVVIDSYSFKLIQIDSYNYIQSNVHSDAAMRNHIQSYTLVQIHLNDCIISNALNVHSDQNETRLKIVTSHHIMQSIQRDTMKW